MKSLTTLFTFIVLTLSVQLFAESQSKEASPAPTPAANQPLSPEKVHETKCIFLYCSLISAETMLGADDAATCSINFELLKAKVFDGSFPKLMEFWQANKTKEAYEALCKPKPQPK